MGTVLTMLACISACLRAQESDEELKRRVDALQKKVDELEAREAERTAREVAPPVLPDSLSLEDWMAPDGDHPLMTMARETKLSGFVDMGYLINFNNPSSTKTPNTNVDRIFDDNPNSFYLHQAQLMLERTATERMIVGYRIRLAAGSDAQVLSKADPSQGSSFINLEEAFIQVLAPLGSGLDIRLGHFETLAGYEVIESKDDMNYSRSLLFSVFTHTGIRASYNLNPELKVTMGLNNGWDEMLDPNHGKTLESQVEVKPFRDLVVDATAYYGAENGFHAGGALNPYAKRFLTTLVGIYQIDRLTLSVEGDYFTQEDAFDVAGGDQNAQWHGVAGWAKYQVNDWFAPAVRVEYLGDPQGWKETNPGTGAFGIGARYIEATLTAEFKVAGLLIVRAELRHDDSNKDVFWRGSGRGGPPSIPNAKTQNTLGFEAILPF